ncbi:helix-turn-helix domain-containing protein [Streptomyces sp. NPDC005840]|uniref:helix-turn-helix domain-containing protein n=1 Tax=Streptomyces sp. NPDC005840 TaxID=3157072 RepID=UPI0033DF7477
MTPTKDPERWADLGEWIALRRKELGMDQKQLAEVAGVSENTIGNYERGRVPARGKMAPGYARVEKALQFARGSFQGILRGYSPRYAVEGESADLLILRNPDDVEDPKAKALIPMIGAALQHRKLAMAFADLAYRWNASDEVIDRFKVAAENLMIDMITPPHGPAEVVEYLKELEAQGLPVADTKRPELGWMALVADLDAADRLDTAGARLLSARVSSGISRQELSQSTRIPERIIRQMETDDFNFPGAFLHAPVYIELLADALRVPSDPIVAAFKAEHSAPDVVAESASEYEGWRDDGGLEEAFPGRA